MTIQTFCCYFSKCSFVCVQTQHWNVQVFFPLLALLGHFLGESFLLELFGFNCLHKFTLSLLHHGILWLFVPVELAEDAIDLVSHARILWRIGLTASPRGSRSHFDFFASLHRFRPSSPA